MNSKNYSPKWFLKRRWGPDESAIREVQPTRAILALHKDFNGGFDGGFDGGLDAALACGLGRAAGHARARPASAGPSQL